MEEKSGEDKAFYIEIITSGIALYGSLKKSLRTIEISEKKLKRAEIAFSEK